MTPLSSEAKPMTDEDPFVDDDRPEEDHSTSEGSSATERSRRINMKASQPVFESESVVVHQAEVMTFVTLLYAAAGMGVAVRLLTKDEDSKDFNFAFENYANLLVKETETRLGKADALLRTLTASFESYAAEQEVRSEKNSTGFPFVTIPGFLGRTQQTLFATNANSITWNPFVLESNVDAWNNYSSEHYEWWSAQGTSQVSDFVQWKPLDKNGGLAASYAPQWQFNPLSEGQINQNRFETPAFARSYETITETGESALTETIYNTSDPMRLPPSFSFLTPSRHNDNIISGVLELNYHWETLFQDALPNGLKPLAVVLSDTCNPANKLLYNVVGPKAAFVRMGGVYNNSFKKKFFQAAIYHTTPSIIETSCVHTMTVYPTEAFEDDYKSSDSLLYLCVVIGVFFVMIVAFLIYAWSVHTRQKVVTGTIEKTTAIVASIFPENVQDRIYREARDHVEQEKKAAAAGHFGAALAGIMGDAAKHTSTQTDKPIADLFTECTVMFADIVGFTAWSSTREPSQVFTLLETIYHHFDEIAARRRVFKVETVGECYVAVCGLPEARKDHAQTIARFANDCLNRFNGLVKQLVVELGPDTEDLMIRIGIHSGPVTAGVLRSERARFQLFGDTVNTTARMETTGLPNCIHVSSDTAKYLMEAGKEQWLTPRADPVVAKGKGELKTYWLDKSKTTKEVSERGSTKMDSTGASSETQSAVASEDIIANKRELTPEEDKGQYQKYMRLIAWNFDVLSKSLIQVIAQRSATSSPHDSEQKMREAEQSLSSAGMAFKQVKDIVQLPTFDWSPPSSKTSEGSVKLPDKVRDQLSKYVQELAAMYNENSFHNFEHASHVTMSVCKLLSRIFAPKNASNGSSLHDNTYGITSDPLTHFAVVLSALIHDADHPGVPNSTLTKEGAPLAAAYNNQSVAEQNSLDLAWQLLMEDEFTELRRSIYINESGLVRFRQLIVNVVMATDITDKELTVLRNRRWDAAFSSEAEDVNELDCINRKATIVLEHLIQASDVAHTMQHWQVYKKWNMRLFMEVYKAYETGRAKKNPAENWYRGELGFFDFYIIPLARKLKDCGVFGVSSDEYLNYALQNRAEWEHNGQLIVAEYVESAKTASLVPAPLSAKRAPEKAPKQMPEQASQHHVLL